MSALPDIGTIAYNGFVFPVETETTDVSIKPVYDQAERTIVASRFSLTIRTIINATSYLALESTLEAIVSRLTHPGMPFRYAGRGLPMSINVGSVRDVNWGPKPRVVNFKPLGGGRTAELTWTVEVEIPTCYSAAYSGPMEFNFSLSYDIGPNGVTKRTYSGHVKIANNRAGLNSRKAGDSADYYRDDINPDLLPGFRRIPGNFTLSTDRSTLEFRIEDVQFGPNFPPPGIVECSAEHSMGNSPGKGWMYWQGTISATYEVARNGTATEIDALNAFGRLCRDRIGTTLFRLGQGPAVPPPPPAPLSQTAGGGQFSSQAPPGQIPAGTTVDPIPAGARQPDAMAASPTAGSRYKPRTVIPVKFDFSEPEIYGPALKCRYSLTYAIVGVPIGEILGLTGMWRPTPDGTNWTTWIQSMGDVLGPRGHAGLVFDVRDDAIVDLCREAPSAGAQASAEFGTTNRPWRTLQQLGIFRPPTPDSSWISYKNAIRIEPHDGTIAVSTLPTKSIPRGNGVANAVGPSAPLPSWAREQSVENRLLPGGVSTRKSGGGGGTGGSEYGSGSQNVAYMSVDQLATTFGLGAAQGIAEIVSIQKRKSSIALYMTGEALRLNFPIACPELVDAGGVRPEPACRQNRGEGFWTGVVGNAGWPVVAARWNLRYELAEMPTQDVELPSNPLEGAK